MITVWGRATSANVQIVMWAAAEIGLDVERHDVGGKFGGTDTPQYVAMNPNKLVPTIQDGDLILWESAAITRYLAATYGDASFWPGSPAARAPIDQWAEWTKTTFVPAFQGGLFAPLIFMPEAKRDPAAIAAAAEKVKPLAKMMDDRMSQSAYLGGDKPAFGDCIFGVLLYRYFTLDGFERTDTPNMRAYYDRLVKRPAYAEHVMVSFEGMRVR